MVYWCQGHLIAGYQGTCKQLNLSWRTSQEAGYSVTWRDLLDACRLLEQFSHWNTDFLICIKICFETDNESTQPQFIFYLYIRVYTGLFVNGERHWLQKCTWKVLVKNKIKIQKNTEKTDSVNLRKCTELLPPLQTGVSSLSFYACALLNIIT